MQGITFNSSKSPSFGAMACCRMTRFDMAKVQTASNALCQRIPQSSGTPVLTVYPRASQQYPVGLAALTGADVITAYRKAGFEPKPPITSPEDPRNAQLVYNFQMNATTKAEEIGRKELLTEKLSEYAQEMEPKGVDASGKRISKFIWTDNGIMFPEEQMN